MIVIGFLIAVLLLFGIPAMFYKYGPGVGKGGAEVLAFMWIIFACFPCVGVGVAIAKQIEELFK